MPGTTPHRPRFDASSLLEIVGNDRAFLEEFVTLFRTDSASLLREIETAIERGDPKAVRRPGHSLRGMLLYLGPSKALDLTLSLEARAAGFDADELAEGFEQLSTEIELIWGDLDRL